MISPRWGWLVIGIVALFLFELGGRGLNEPDEGRYANIAREGLEADHPWYEPRLSGLGHYDKPPLIYWATSLSFRIFGVNEWAARLPSFFGALFALIGLGWAAWRLYGRETAWRAVLVGATLAHVWLLARFLTPDMLLTGWCALAIGAWAETRHRGGCWRWWTVSAVFWTLAWWTKATPALIPLLGLVLGVYLTGDRAGQKALRCPLLLPVMLIFGMPWFVFMFYRHADLKDFFLHRELVGRVKGHVDGRHGPIYYYLLISVLAWLPWWPVAAWQVWKQRAGQVFRPWREKLGVEGIIALTGLVIFSCISSKLPTYTLIVAPWVALVLTRCLGAFSQRQLLIPAVGMAIIYASLAVAAPHYETRLGHNSSLKQVVNVLRQQGAKRVVTDAYWPGLEVYFGGEVQYAGVKVPLEVATDTQETAEHFLYHEMIPDQLSPGSWYVHFRKFGSSPLQRWLDNPALEKIQIGDFEIGRMAQ